MVITVIISRRILRKPTAKQAKSGIMQRQDKVASSFDLDSFMLTPEKQMKNWILDKKLRNASDFE